MKSALFESINDRQNIINAYSKMMINESSDIGDEFVDEDKIENEMKKHGYWLDEFLSDDENGRLVFNSRDNRISFNNGWKEVEEWLNGVLFDRNVDDEMPLDEIQEIKNALISMGVDYDVEEDGTITIRISPTIVYSLDNWHDVKMWIYDRNGHNAPKHRYFKNNESCCSEKKDKLNKDNASLANKDIKKILKKNPKMKMICDCDSSDYVGKIGESSDFEDDDNYVDMIELHKYYIDKGYFDPIEDLDKINAVKDAGFIIKTAPNKDMVYVIEWEG